MSLIGPEKNLHSMDIKISLCSWNLAGPVCKFKNLISGGIFSALFVK